MGQCTEISFRDGDWLVVTDQVMGGASTWQCSIQHAELCATGVLSTEGNGGFVSLQSRVDCLHIPENAIGIQIEWRSNREGWRFLLHERGRQAREYYGHCMNHRTQSFYFHQCTYSKRGQTDPHRKVEYGRELEAIGFLLRTVEEGYTTLEIQNMEWICG